MSQAGDVMVERPDDVAWASAARRISDGMLAAAAALAGLSDAAALGAALLPPVTSLRATSAAVVAQAARAEGLAQVPPDDPAKQVAEAMWVPAYPMIEAV